jgi:cytochrome c-type biogenesis protein CcmH
MTAFWIMTALARRWRPAGAGRRATRRGRRRRRRADAAARELAELDRLKARGLLDEAGWTAARAEAGRRILAGGAKPVPLRSGPPDRFWCWRGRP